MLITDKEDNLIEITSDPIHLSPCIRPDPLHVMQEVRHRPRARRHGYSTIVLTGTIDFASRNQLKEWFELNGAKVAGSVSRNTTYLVAGDKSGSKETKAKELGVDVLRRAELLELMQNRVTLPTNKPTWWPITSDEPAKPANLFD